MVNGNGYATGCELLVAAMLLNHDIEVYLQGQDQTGQTIFTNETFQTRNHSKLEKIILLLNNNHFNLLKTKVTTITRNKLQVPTKRNNSSDQTEGLQGRSIQSELQPIHVQSFHKEPPIKQSTLHQSSGNTIIPEQQILVQHPLGLPHQLLQNDLNQNQENNNIPLPDKCILHHRTLGVPYEYPLATETNQKRILRKQRNTRKLTE